jgi:phosphatidylglycerol:prolipoprotein diacylglycerol transferase
LHPVLLDLGLLQIPTYGVLCATGMLLALWLSVRAGRREQLPAATILDLFFWLLCAGIAGSWLLHALLQLPHYSTGFVFYGGAIAAAAALWLFARRRRLDPWRLGDLLAPGAALGHALGRLGCFAAGCCYGKACPAPPGVHFPELDAPAHPTQLYEAAGLVALFFALVALRTRKRFHGAVLLAYAAGYATLRFVVEFWRGDPRGELGGWATSQIVAMVVVAVAALAASLRRLPG